MYEYNLEQLKYELLLSYSKLKKANATLKQLIYQQQIQIQNSIPKELITSIQDLELTHKLCVEDITRYKEEIKKLQLQLNEGEKKIKQLKEENEQLKKIKENKKCNETSKNNMPIKNTVQLSKILGFESKKSSEIEKEMGINNNNQSKNFNSKNNDVFNKKKSELEKKFKELKEKTNRFNEVIEDQENIINKNKNFLNELDQNMNNYLEGINISIKNSKINEENDLQKKMDEIYKQIEDLTISLVNMDDIVLNVKNKFAKNIENLLNDINSEFVELNLDNNQNEYNFNNISKKIINGIEEIEKIFEVFWNDYDDFYEKNHKIEEDMNKLKYLYKKYGEEYKKKREKSLMNALKDELSISQIQNNQQFDNINNINNINNFDINEFNDINNNIPGNNIKDKGLGESFMLNIKDDMKKEDLYKTINIFKETEEDKLLEQYIEEAQLLRKNYHVICYIYDDFDFYDVSYDLKAVGLRGGEYFPKCSHGFNYGKEIEIQSFAINGQEYPYIKKHHSIEFIINLYNFQTSKVHILYKSTINKLFLTQNELKERNIYRSEYYGLDKSLSGQKAKISLILKGSFDIVNFKEYFLVRNQKNKKEIEYMWGGIVPYGGKTTLVMLSKKEATWSFNYTVNLHSNSYLRNTMLYIPIEFIGGNNEIIDINSNCQQSTNIILDEEQRQYSIEFFNTQYKEAKFSIEGTLKNKCKGEWEVDLTDEKIEQLMPEADVLCKEQLKFFAKKIIDEFNNKNKNNDFIFHDYQKIGFWVYENIKYDLNYTGKSEYTAVDIYNMRKGVCHHFTRLANALLYSLGYKVLYASGYTCKGNNSFKTSTGHAWSLIKLNDNKWYPFDATWGIFTGKLPVGHIFSCFAGKHLKTLGHDTVSIDKHELEGAFIG